VTQSPPATFSRTRCPRSSWWQRPDYRPAVALSLAVFGFNMLGVGLRDLLDPRLKGS
jgi:ABC-type dipeptide/oligopeptide/nickel transport system permease subunit